MDISDEVLAGLFRACELADHELEARHAEDPVYVVQRASLDSAMEWVASAVDERSGDTPVTEWVGARSWSSAGG